MTDPFLLVNSGIECPPDLTFETLHEFVDVNAEVEVVDSALGAPLKENMKLKDAVEAIVVGKNILNILSLEVSGEPIGKDIQAPTIVRRGEYQRHWPYVTNPEPLRGGNADYAQVRELPH